MPPSIACRSCQLPVPVLDGGRLFCTPVLDHTRAHLAGFLTARGLAVSEGAPGVLSVELPPGRLARLAVDLAGALTRPELEGTRCVLVPAGCDPGLGDIARAGTLWSLIGRVQGQWVADVLAEARLEMHYQPIVSASDPARVFGFECLARARERDGSLLGASGLFRAAGDAELLFQLDRATRLLAIADSARHAGDARIFINFTPNAIYDPAFCLRTTVSAIEAAGIRPERVVFEVTESEEIGDLTHLLGILAFYRRNGFGVAVDDLGAGYSSLNLLTRLKPDFVKLDRELIHGVHEDAFKARLVASILDVARDLRVTSVAEGVETEAEWHWARDHGAELVQGFLFGQPGTPPPLPRVPDSHTIAHEEGRPA